ncbi:TIGR02452 family protein [Clostridium felsineum]|uniref:TIGR02452 family protein n=1 Tax=Clostridium felsineum TaxID=36839 RepID=UPI00214D508A|nr:TIGR02452 family protein [Clostridium felsineum]MCR3761064.1 TIGR02452 family protein [Clostridium felsineum]
MLNKRENFKNIASKTLSVIDNGYYINKSNEKIDIKAATDKAIEGTELIDELKNKKEIKSNFSFDKVEVTVVNNSTINEIIELRGNGINGNIVALNFASAKNPGGGFISGANAQEESIARASSMYPCLIKYTEEFYEWHKKQKTPLYSDKMIYSPEVPIFRDDSGEFLRTPIKCSFITSPAVNAGVARQRGISEEKITEAMENRINNIIKLALSKNPKAIVLGAFGCGVFRNAPTEVARIFREKLKENIKNTQEIKIIFAIYDRSMTMINVFQKELKEMLIGR